MSKRTSRRFVGGIGATEYTSPPVMKKTSLAVLFLTVFIDLVGFGMVIPFLSFYAREYGARGVTVGAVVGIYSIMQFFFAPVWGRLSDRIGRRPVILISLTASCIGYFLFAISRSLTLLFVFRGHARTFPYAARRLRNGDERDAARARPISFSAARSRVFFSFHGSDRRHDPGRIDRQACARTRRTAARHDRRDVVHDRTR